MFGVVIHPPKDLRVEEVPKQDLRPQGSVSSHASVVIFGMGQAAVHAFCMMLSAMHVALAKRARRRDAETI